MNISFSIKNIFTNTFTPVDITIFVLICLGIIAIIVALIYTKLISKNKFGHQYDSFLVKKNYKQKILNIINNFQETQVLFNLFLKLPIDHCKGLNSFKIFSMIITPFAIVCIFLPLDNRIFNVKYNKNNFECFDKKNFNIMFPIEIQNAISCMKKFQSYIGVDVFYVIPCVNKNINEKVVSSNNKIICISEKKLEEELVDLLNHILKKQIKNEKNVSCLVGSINKINYQKTLKLPFITNNKNKDMW